MDRSRTSAEQEDPFLHLGKVRDTDDGIIVRGAKMLGTMAPSTEEVAVLPFGGVAPGDDAYALVFAVPIDDQAPLLDVVDRALGKRPDLDIPTSPDNPGAFSSVRPPTGILTAAYPASSHPQPGKSP